MGRAMPPQTVDLSAKGASLVLGLSEEKCYLTRDLDANFAEVNTFGTRNDGVYSPRLELGERYYVRRCESWSACPYELRMAKHPAV